MKMDVLIVYKYRDEILNYTASGTVDNTEVFSVYKLFESEAELGVTPQRGGIPIILEAITYATQYFATTPSAVEIEIATNDEALNEEIQTRLLDTLDSLVEAEIDERPGIIEAAIGDLEADDQWFYNNAFHTILDYITNKPYGIAITTTVLENGDYAGYLGGDVV